jgi:prepilin-type N-terminal cleavage/methylation domain-containing protein
MNITRLKDQRGFTLMELLVASVCTTIVLGGAVALTAQIQSGYRKQMEDSVGEQEARYALEWIGRYLRSVGNDPFGVPDFSTCPVAGTEYLPLEPDPNGDSVHNDIALQADVNPPDKLIGGSTGNCTQKNENVKISLNTTLHEIQFEDIGANVTSTTRTDAVIDNLQFSYLNADADPWDPATGTGNIYYVATTITIRPRSTNLSGTANRSLMSTVRVRGR